MTTQEAIDIVICTKKSRVRLKTLADCLALDGQWINDQIMSLAKYGYRLKQPPVCTARPGVRGYTMRAIMSKKEGLEVILPKDGGKPIRYSKHGF